jgi:hypothetical protein
MLKKKMGISRMKIKIKLKKLKMTNQQNQLMPIKTKIQMTFTKMYHHQECKKSERPTELRLTTYKQLQKKRS